MKISKIESVVVEFETFDIRGHKNIETNLCEFEFSFKNYGIIDFLIGFDSEKNIEEEMKRMIDSDYLLDMIKGCCHRNIELAMKVNNSCENFPFEELPIDDIAEDSQKTLAEIDTYCKKLEY